MCGEGKLLRHSRGRRNFFAAQQASMSGRFQSAEADLASMRDFKMISDSEARIRKAVGAIFFIAGYAVMLFRGVDYFPFYGNYLMLAIGVMVYRMGVCSQ
jgi:hypothetical protein